MSDHPVAARQKKHRLGVPVISGQRPTMMEKDRLAGTPSFVINLSTVFHCDRIHICSPFRFLIRVFVSNVAKLTALTGRGRRTRCLSAVRTSLAKVPGVESITPTQRAVQSTAIPGVELYESRFSLD
jgi:hypothetical protein